MKIEEVKRLPVLDQFLYFVKERHQVYLRRRMGRPKPWTDDEIIQRTRFTNIYRELDKVTVWYTQNIREPLKDDPRVAFATIAFRWFNYPGTGEQLMRAGNQPYGALLEWDLATVMSRLKYLAANGMQIFTGAFNISNAGQSKPKIDGVCEDYLEPIWQDRSRLMALLGSKPSLATFHSFLCQYRGMGGSGFMSAQVVADLKYTPFLANASDWWTFCCLGPGSKRGLNMVMGRDYKSPLDRAWPTEIEWLRALVNNRPMPKMHAQDLQNCLCEFSKYQFGLQGFRPKRGYKGVS